ncbi:hypothetical protein DM01DRAFT_1350054 [Hesseltinella vesiculosa]|nr:hypothetical protein DM01DRAFT_1350054 [Hesseltinella vesiculosa]
MHTIDLPIDTGRLKSSQTITFVKAPTPNSDTRLLCFVCKSMFTSKVDLREHFNAHVAEQEPRPLSRHRSPARKPKRPYKVLSDNIPFPETVEEKWCVDELQVSDTLLKVREQVAKKNKLNKALTDAELLALDHVYVFSGDQRDSTSGFTLGQHTLILESIDMMNENDINVKFLTPWCSQLAVLDKPSWRKVKTATKTFSMDALNSSDPNELLAADALDNLAGRLIRREESRLMLEDSFAHKYLDTLFDPVFGSQPGLSSDW